MDKLSIMLIVPDTARADISITPGRTYYHFATTSSVDEGDLPGLNERFVLVTERILEAVKPRTDEQPIEPGSIKVTIFIDNMLKPTKDITEQSLKRLVDELMRLDNVFTFLKGFTQ